MRKLNPRELAAYAAGALDPGEATAVADALAVDAEARRRLAALNLRMDEIRGIDRWRIPRLAVEGRVEPLAAALAGAAMTGGRAVRGGHPFAILVNPPDRAEAWRPVVVREHDGVSEVVYPTTAEEWRSLDAWPRAGEARELVVVAASEPGRHRYVIALSPVGAEVDWAAAPDARWAELRAGVEDGTTFAAAVELEVA